MKNNGNFYCNQKFWWLTVNLEKHNISSCCAASPQQANINWITKNPGQLFNAPELQDERRAMLNNIPVSSCNSSCWNAESQGLPSRRTIMSGDTVTHNFIDAQPETLNIIVGSDCNMTCVYCCKFYSTAWSRDVVKKSYEVISADDRFVVNTTDRILSRLSQKDLLQSNHRQILLDEIIRLCQTSSLTEIMITGGEPFLYLYLEQIIEAIPAGVSLKVWSGLGVDESRFKKEIAKLPKDTTVIVSAENVKERYEFVRHGNTWQRFLNNIETLKNAGINYEFNATVTNLTVFGLPDFIKYAGNVPITFSACTDPDFLSVGVLDQESKKLVRHSTGILPDFVSRALEVSPTENQIHNLKKYASDYSQRRQLDLSIFPRSFVNWLEQ